MKSWRATFGLALLTAPGYAAALALMAEHHRGFWAQVGLGMIVFGGFFLMTGGDT